MFRRLILAALVCAATVLLASGFRPQPTTSLLTAAPHAAANYASAFASVIVSDPPGLQALAPAPAFVDLDNDGEDDRNDEREEDEENDPDRVGPDGRRRIGNDHPLEAMRFRNLSLQDENGIIAENGLIEAAQHARAMRGLEPPPDAGAGISRGSWTWLGPGNIGGRIRALAIHPTVPATMFAGSVGGGIWKTTDGGAMWAPVDDFMANLAVSTIVFTPGSPSIMYAGTGEGFYNADGIRGAGIFKSTDGGATWAQLPFASPSQLHYVNRIAASPDGGTILAATRTGIYRSTDGGTTLTSQLGVEMMDIDFHPTDSLKAVASGSFGDAYYTIDGGVTWTAATGISGERVEIAYAPSSPDTVYASVEASGGSFYVSSNGGASYTLRFSGSPDYLGSQGWYDNALWVNPADPNFIVVGGIDLYKSTNGGTSWLKISNWAAAPSSAHADHHVIASHPGFNNSTNKIVYFGNDGGVYRASDVSTVGGGGAGNCTGCTSGWTALNNNLGVTQFYGGAGHPGTGKIVGGTQDNGTLVYSPSSGPQAWTTSFGGDGGWSAYDPNNANTLYGEYVYLTVHRSLNGGASSDWINGLYWNGSSYVCKAAPYKIGDGSGSDGCSPSSYGTGANFISPFILDPSNSQRLLAGGLRLWRTNDADTPNTATTGPSWLSIKPSVGSNISAIAVAKTNSDIVWVGHGNGNVYRTADGTGAAPTWVQRDTTSPALPNRFVTRITIDPSDANIVYVTFGGFNANNIYRTVDGGATWTNIAGTGLTALPAAPIRDLEVHPSNSNWLYAATEVGVFASEDAGSTWMLPHDGPANVSVDELFFMGTELVAVTHGRGMFKQVPVTTPATISVSPNSVAPSGTVTITIANGPGNTRDWVAVRSGGVSRDWWYLNGTKTAPSSGIANGSFGVPMPATPGTYEFRLYANDTQTVLATTSDPIDVTPLPDLRINDVSVTEGNSGTATATFTVTLTPASAQQVTVNYATANATATSGSDYTAASGTLTFAAGVTTQQFNVTVSGDTTPEPAETFVVNLTSPSNATLGDAQGVGTITNDDAAPPQSISASPSSVTWGSNVTVTVANGPANRLDWVALRTNGTNVDWWYLNGTKTAPVSGVSGATLTVPMPATAGFYEFRLLENDGANVLAISNTVTVTAPSSLSINDVAVAEGDSGTTTATFTVTLSPASAQSVTVNYATANATATAGTDYTAATGTLTFAAGVTTQQFSVTVAGDTTSEPNETFGVNLTSPSNAIIGDAQGIGTITNDDSAPTPTISASPSSVVGGGTVTVTFANGPGNARDWVAVRSGGVNRDWWYLNGTKTAPVTPVTSGNFTVTMPAAAGTYEFRLLENDGANLLATSGNVTVTAPPSLTINDVSVTEGNSGTSTATFTVTLSPASAQQVTVNYATANGTATAGSDYAAASGLLTFATGVTTQTVTVTVNGDTSNEPNETFVVNLSTPSGATIGDGQGAGTITNDDAPAPPTISAVPGSVAAGGSVTVTTTNGPGNRLDWIALRSGGVNRDWWYLNGTKTPPVTGMTASSFPVSMPAAGGSYEFRLLENDGANVLATSGAVTVTALPSFSINDVSVAEGAIATTNATFTVTLSAASASTVTVNYASANGSATAGSDYTAASGTLTFNAGITTQTFSVAVNGDSTVEPNENFVVNLSSPSGATIGDGQGIGTITNDDVPPPPAISASPSSTAGGGIVSVAVTNGPGNALDWVVLRSGGVNRDWWYLNGTKTAPSSGLNSAGFNVTMPLNSGTYEFRLLENDGPNVLATSNSVTVEGLPSLSINDVSVTEGSSGTTNATFTVSLSASSAFMVTVSYASANGTAAAGSDYTAASGTLTFNPGTTTQTFSVSVIGDSTAEPNENFVVNLSSPAGATIADGQGIGTITTDDAPPSPTISVSPSTVVGLQWATVTIFNGPGNRLDWVAARSGGINRDWWYMNGVKTAPASGVTSASFQVRMPATAGTYTLVLLENDGPNVLATSTPFTVTAAPALSINDVSVVEGPAGLNSSLNFTITLSEPSAEALAVSYATAGGTATSGADFSPTSNFVIFPAGTTTRTVGVTVIGDTAVEGNETLFVNLSPALSAVIADGQGVGTIINDDTGGPPTISASPASVAPAGSVTVTVNDGPANARDWVAVRRGGVIQNWWYLNGLRTPPTTGRSAATLSLAMPSTPGAYDFVLLANDTQTVLAQSGPVTVTAGTCADTDSDRLCDAYETGSNFYAGPANTGTSPTNPDTDGDGLTDGDEVLGTLGGLNLRGMGANPLKKNILFEYDWIDDSHFESFEASCGAHSHRPTAAIIDRVSAAFAASPLTNPDGTTGITLIHDYGQGGELTGGTVISHAANITGGVNGTDYGNTKAANFASNRNGYFHYVLMAHYYTEGLGSSGQAELPGDDLIVTLGCSYSSTNFVANTIMHEAGHNFNIRHGGNENCNWKPNYNSVMNYRFQFNGVDANTSCNALGSSGESNTLDYSRGTRIALNEASLNENAGVCGSTAIDWNSSGTITTGLAYELNRDIFNGGTIQNGSCSANTMTLNDNNDWATLSFTGLSDGDGSLLGLWLYYAKEIITETNTPPRVPPAALQRRQ
jgi:hypothetical protein